MASKQQDWTGLSVEQLKKRYNVAELMDIAGTEGVDTDSVRGKTKAEISSAIFAKMTAAEADVAEEAEKVEVEAEVEEVKEQKPEAPKPPPPKSPGTLVIEATLNAPSEEYLSEVLFPALAEMWRGVQNLGGSDEVAAEARAELAALIKATPSEVVGKAKEMLANPLAMLTASDDFKGKLQAIVAAESKLDALGSVVKDSLVKHGIAPVAPFYVRYDEATGHIEYAPTKSAARSTAKRATSANGGESSYVPMSDEFKTIKWKKLEAKWGDLDWQTIWKDGQAFGSVVELKKDGEVIDTVVLDTANAVKGGIPAGETHVNAATMAAKLAATLVFSLSKYKSQAGKQFAGQFWMNPSDGSPKWGNDEKTSLLTTYKGSGVDQTFTFRFEVDPS